LGRKKQRKEELENWELVHCGREDAQDRGVEGLPFGKPCKPSKCENTGTEMMMIMLTTKMK
jgi:hypothetical protein